MDEVARWLDRSGLGQYAALFAENEIDAPLLPELTDQDLKELGLPLGHRKRLLKAVAALRGESREIAPSPAGMAGPSAAAERRQLTVMFCDLVGSTALAERLDPEDLREVLRAYRRACAEVIADCGGRVAKFLGDGLVAYFGYPLAHEDDAVRAVRAGLQILSAMQDLSEQVKHDRGVWLRVRIGIHTGLVVAGEIGEGEAREELAAVGETPNVAERLQAVAAPDTMVISPATQRLVEGLFVLEDLGPQDLKGIAEPLRVHRVIAESGAANPFEARAEKGLTPLVGRESELGLLSRHWEQACEGELRVVLLSGEAGIGKSRMLRAFRESLNAEPHARMLFYCSPYHQNSAFWPVIDQLQRTLRFAADDGPVEKLSKFDAMLRGLDLSASMGPVLAAFLGLPAADGQPLLDLAPQQLKRRMLDVLLAMIDAATKRQPGLMVVEDAHWLDPSTLELLQLCLERLRTSRLMLLITARPEFKPNWSYPQVFQLGLDRLSRRERAAMVDRIAGGKPLPGPVLAQIVAKTDGIPLFVEELTKAVLESDLLRDAGDRYHLTAPLPQLAIPDTLQGSLLARLDRLAPVKEVAQVGAVIGREFSYELLAAIAPLAEDRLRDALRQLLDAELIFRRAAPPDARYVFKHALVQEVAYQSLLRSRRQALHARIAKVLQEHLPDVAAAQPEVLAHHFTEAGLPAEAVAFWHQAGQRAIERSANLEAVAHFGKGLELLPGLPDPAQRSQAEIRLQMALGLALLATKGPAPEVVEAYGRARELCEQVGDTRQLHAAVWGLWYFNQVRMQIEPARDLAAELLRLAERQPDSGLVLQAHHAAWTTAFIFPDLLSCWQHTERGRALYDAEAHRAHKFLYGGHDPGTCARSHGALALWLLGHPDQAAERMREGVALARELAHPFSLIVTFIWASLVHQFRGAAGPVEESAGSAIALCDEQNMAPQFRAVGTVMRGWATAVQGRPAEGAAQAGEGIASLRALGVDSRRSYFLTLLAEAQKRAGRLDEAARALAEAWDFVGARREGWWEAEIHRLQGELMLARSAKQHEGAEACFRRAIEVAREQSARSLELRAAFSLARLWRDQGRRAEARDLLTPVYGSFTEGYDTPDLKDAKALLDALA